jgi:hypothetical protein
MQKHLLTLISTVILITSFLRAYAPKFVLLSKLEPHIRHVPHAGVYTGIVLRGFNCLSVIHAILSENGNPIGKHQAPMQI